MKHDAVGCTAVSKGASHIIKKIFKTKILSSTVGLIVTTLKTLRTKKRAYHYASLLLTPEKVKMKFKR